MRRGNDRRQPILKEGQVASLYGEQTLRDLAFQSETMPCAVPLAFGCGYLKGGDWSPAYHEIERYTPNRPTPLQRMLQPAFAWFDSLADLKGSVADAYYRERVRRRGLPAIAGGMGFSSLSALINEATVNGKRDANNWFMKNSVTTVAGAAYDSWLWTGYPGAGTIPAANVAATVLDNTVAGSFKQANAPASNTKHVVSVSGMSTVAAGALLIVDRTLGVQPILATLTGQTITGSPTRYQSNGNNGVLIWAMKGAAADANAAPNLTVTYTESVTGATAHTTGVVTGNATNPAYRTEIGTGQLFFPLASGDVGVRRIETTTWSVARSQATWFGLAYPYCWLPLGVANALFGTDLINTQFNLVQVVDGAAISFFLQAATTSSGVIQGELVLVSGNS